MRISDWSSDVCSSDLIVLQPLADALHHQAHRLAGDGGEALYPQHAVGGDDRAQAFQQGLGVLRLAERDREGGEVVVVVLAAFVVVRPDRKSTRLNSSH